MAGCLPKLLLFNSNFNYFFTLFVVLSSFCFNYNLISTFLDTLLDCNLTIFTYFNILFSRFLSFNFISYFFANSFCFKIKCLTFLLNCRRLVSFSFCRSLNLLFCFLNLISYCCCSRVVTDTFNCNFVSTGILLTTLFLIYDYTIFSNNKLLTIYSNCCR